MITSFKLLSLLPFTAWLLAPLASATTLVFERSQTLGGWHEREFTTTWTDLAPDVKNRISTDVNGDLRGFNGSTSTTWLQSPDFYLEAGPITIDSIYLLSTTDPAPTSDDEVSETVSSSGWTGIALRNASGAFVLTYSTATEWQPVTFSSETLAPFLGQQLTLNFINMNSNSGDLFYVNRPITISGSLVVVPEPSALLSAGCLLASIFLVRRRTRLRI